VPERAAVHTVAQRGVRASSDGAPLREDAVGACSEKLAARALTLIASVHAPRIGCALAGGRREQSAPVVHELRCGCGVRVRGDELDTGAGPQR
jgi:hypothetical protein